MTLNHGALRMEWDLAIAAIAQVELVIRYFAERVCKWYSLLVLAQSANYRDLLNVVLSEAQLKCEFYGGFRVMVSENGHSKHICDAGSKEEREGRTPPPERRRRCCRGGTSPGQPFLVSFCTVFACVSTEYA